MIVSFNLIYNVNWIYIFVYFVINGSNLLSRFKDRLYYIVIIIKYYELKYCLLN